MNIRTPLLVVLCAFVSCSCYSQGTVNFGNTSTTLISAGNSAPIPTSQTFYFGLFIAEPGTTDPAAFVFTGLYATNHATFAGRFSGGLELAVPNWPAGERRSYLVRGWSSSLGHDWETVQRCFQGGYGWGTLGASDIAEGTSGGVVGGQTLYALNLFGSTGLQGFRLDDILAPSYPPVTVSAAGPPTDQGFPLLISSTEYYGEIKIWTSTNCIDWLPLGSFELFQKTGIYVDTSPPGPRKFYKASSWTTNP